MKNLEKFYPGTKIEDFKVEGSEYTKDIGATFAVCAMDCSECPARTFATMIRKTELALIRLKHGRNGRPYE